MHGDGPIADEQGAGDLPVAVALDQQGQHVRFAVGKVELGPGGGRAGGRAGLLASLARRARSSARASSGADGSW